MIIDKETIYLCSGSGGEGDSSLRRLSSRKTIGYGGDGGSGGDVILGVSSHLYDLRKFKGNKKFIAGNGAPGKGNNKKGKDAQDLFVGLPQGTRVLEGERLLVDFASEKGEFLICRGGAGGKGNYRSDYALSAKEGRARQVTLDYRIPNDVAILGFANSGKTTLFNALTNKNRKVAEYPFTTSSCFWAKSEYEFKEFTVLDTPPFKKTKDSKELSENIFLRHIFRSKIILFLSNNSSDFNSDFEGIKREINLYGPSLLKGKKIFYLLNKIDTIGKRRLAHEVMALSPIDTKDITRFKQIIVEALGIK